MPIQSNNPPRVSVITCTYNSESVIRDNLESVWSDCAPFEQLIVDAESKDRTIEIVKQFQKKGCNIKIFYREPQGISDAMNFGISHADGEIIHILHSDDYNLDTEIYKKVPTLFDESDAMWIYGLLKAVNDKGEYIGEQPPKRFRRFHYWLLPLINYVPHPSSFIRKEIFEQWGLFDGDLKIIMDWDFWLRIGKKFPPLVVSEYWCAFRMHDESLSTQEAHSSRIHYEEKRVLKKHFPFPLYAILYLMHRLIYFARFLKSRVLYKKLKS